MARPSKAPEWLTEESLIRIQGWAMDGLSDEQIATEKMGIAYSTFREWKKKYPALLAALKKSKEVADRKVENALYEAALSGNVTAMIFWLKNRKPKEWKDKVETFVNADIDIGSQNKEFRKYLDDEQKRMGNADI